MNVIRVTAIWLSLVGLGMGGASCAKRSKPVTERDRKEAAHVATEAQFALTLRDWARAEGLLSKAVQLSPEADYFMVLGTARVRLGNRGGAKEAYERALRLFEDDAARDEKRVEPWLNQVTVLALLGRADDARAVLNKAAKRYPNDSRIKSLLEPKNFQQMLNDPKFKENAL